MTHPRVRSISHVPRIVLLVLIALLILQIINHHYNSQKLTIEFQQINNPPSDRMLKLASLGSEKLYSYFLILKLQLHDNQVGKNIAYNRLDYERLSAWLKSIYRINPDSDYPAFLASRVYSQVKDPAKIRLMIKLIIDLFEHNPLQHWRRMTEASLLAKHQLKDLEFALELAERVAELPHSADIPYWARDMRLILLDELNQYQSAIILISSLLQSDEIKDPGERKFLQDRLLKIRQSMLDIKQIN